MAAHPPFIQVVITHTRTQLGCVCVWQLAEPRLLRHRAGYRTGGDLKRRPRKVEDEERLTMMIHVKSV